MSGIKKSAEGGSGPAGVSNDLTPPQTHGPQARNGGEQVAVHIR